MSPRTSESLTREALAITTVTPTSAAKTTPSALARNAVFAHMAEVRRSVAYSVEGLWRVPSRPLLPAAQGNAWA